MPMPHAAHPMNCTVLLALNFRYIRDGPRDLCGRRAEVLAVVRLDVDNVALHGAGMAWRQTEFVFRITLHYRLTMVV